jgi:signal transduction histidine kinase
MDTFFSEMTAALAHEIKNPAAVALAHVNLLRSEMSEEDCVHLNHIEKALDNICMLVRDMLSASYTRNDLYEVDLLKILNEILDTYRAAWPDISFLLSVKETSLSCYGHETSLRMIFSNLIKNAVEAIEVSEISVGRIEININKSDDFLQVEILDNATSLYNSYGKPHGNGLGLAICRNLANGLGASISVDESNGCAVKVEIRTFCPSLHNM